MDSAVDDEIQLTLRDYEQIGGLSLALSNHADSVYHKLPPERRPVAETLFRALCQAGAGKRDLRRPEKLGRVAEIAGAPLAHVVEVVEKFRAVDCNFLMPPPPVPLGPETMLDISHESLIRQWQRLQQWAEQEHRSAAEYQFLELTAKKWQSDQGSPLGKRTVQRLLLWRKTEKPNAAWAKRYGDDFELAMRFLDHSILEQRRKRRHEIALVAFIVGLIGAILGLSVYGYFSRTLIDEITRETAENQGTQALEQGDVAHALLRFADSHRADETVRQLRHSIGIRQLPKLVDCWTFASRWKTLGVAFDPGADRLLLFSSNEAKQPSGFIKLVDLAKNVETELGAEPMGHAAFLSNGAVLSAAPPQETPGRVFWLWTRDKTGQMASTPVTLPSGHRGAVLAVHPKLPEAVCMVHKKAGDADTTRVFVVHLNRDRTAEQYEIAIATGADAAASYRADGNGLVVSLKDAGGRPRDVKIYRVINESARAADGAPDAGGAGDRGARLRQRYRELTTFTAPQDINHACLSPTADVVATCHGDQLSQRGAVMLWRREGVQWRPSVLTHPGGVSYAEFSPDGRKLVTACHDGSARLWTLTPSDLKCAGNVTHDLKHGGSVMTANFSPDGLLLATGSRDRRIRVWATRTGTLALPVLSFHETVTAVRFDPSGFKLAATGQRQAQVWEIFTANPPAQTLGSLGDVHDVSIAADGCSVALAGESDGVRLWSPAHTKSAKTQALPSQKGWDLVRTVAIHPLHDGAVVAVVQQRSGAPHETRLVLWHDKKRIPVNRATDGLLVRAAAWSPDGSKLALVGLGAKSGGAAPLQGAGRIIHFKGPGDWRVDEIVSLAEEHSDAILGVQFDAASQWLATASVDDHALVWDLEKPRTNGMLTSVFPPGEQGPDPNARKFAHTADVAQASFSFDRRYLATGSLDGTCKLWDLKAEGAESLVLEHDAAVTAVRWLRVAEAPEQRFLATACRDGVVRVWHVAPDVKEAARVRRLIAVFPTQGYIRDLVYVSEARELTACSTLDPTKRTGPAPDRSDSKRPKLDRSEPEPAQPAQKPGAASGAAAGATPLPASQPVLVTFHKWKIKPQMVPGDHIDFLGQRADRDKWVKVRDEYLTHFRDNQATAQRHHERLAEEAEQQEEWHAAAWHLQRLLEHAGAAVALRAELHERRAMVLVKGNAPVEALRHLEEAARLAPAAAARLAETRARLHADLKQWQGAVRAAADSGVPDFWQRPQYARDLDVIIEAHYDAGLHRQALALLDRRREVEPDQRRYNLVQTAKNLRALDHWKELSELVRGADGDKLFHQPGYFENFILLRYGTLAAFRLVDHELFQRCTSLMDTEYGGEKLSQAERRLVALAALFRGDTEAYGKFCRRMLEKFTAPNDLGDVVPPVAAAGAWTCVLGPLPADDPDADRLLGLAMRLARQANQAGSDQEFRGVLGAVQLRFALRQAPAPRRQADLREALAQLSKEGIPGFDDLFRALGHTHLGEVAQARAAWLRAEEHRRRFDVRGPDPEQLGPFVDYLEFEILRREVERAMTAAGF